MANLYIAEYAAVRSRLALEPAVTTQKVAFTTAAQSSAFDSDAYFVRVLADADCHLLFGADPTATDSHPLYKADIEYWMAIVPGQKVSAYDGSS